MTAIRDVEDKITNEYNLRRMFYGAPDFSVVGPKCLPRIHVKYRDMEVEGSNYPQDHLNFQHSSFELSTLQYVGDNGLLAHNKKPFLVAEMPSMLSLQGVETGTVGLDYFLQLPLSDKFNVSTLPVLPLDRALLIGQPEKFGLRSTQVKILMDRLNLLTKIHNPDQLRTPRDVIDLDDKACANHFADLFTKLLIHPEHVSCQGKMKTGLTGQIAALIKVLKAPGVWFDFTKSDERFRVVSLLWNHENVINNQANRPGAEDYHIFLLQLVLSVELLLRLQAPEEEPEADERDDDVVGADGLTITRKAAWDLVLAERFLQNVQVRTVDIIVEDKLFEDDGGSEVSRDSFVTANEYVDELENKSASSICKSMFAGRAESSQLDALVEFAANLDWPHADDLKSTIEKRRKNPRPRKRRARSSSAASLTVPGRSHGRTCSGSSIASNLAPSIKSNNTFDSNKSHSPNYSNPMFGTDNIGWATRSWLGGLVMPGDSTPILLMSAMIENSPMAMQDLGKKAAGHGVFIYGTRIYSSKACILGRVLAAAEGSKDCMGWISIDKIATNKADTWLEIESKQINTASLARVSFRKEISQDSKPYSFSDIPYLESDFTWPDDEPQVDGTLVEIKALSFKVHKSKDNLFLEYTTSQVAKEEVQQAQLKDTSTLTATLAFLTVLDSQKVKRAMTLFHDSYYISAQPCFVSDRSRYDELVERGPSNEKALPLPPCHPLHKDYHYKIIHALTLLDSTSIISQYGLDCINTNHSPLKTSFSTDPFSYDSRDMSNHNESRKDSGTCSERSSTNNLPRQEHFDVKRVLILDCRTDDSTMSANLQVLARAWCSEIGQHALISRVGRTCIACCVRTARALDLRIVIRS